ncbi:Outer spore wall protein 4 [Saccharomyces cerevisiae]|uniref:Outer spore wall protein 4 n=4 Tax=Saccharomyces cerevisiae TaxID=4932 RepID=LOH1_YEAST|nr:Loh1p [Saccharomyces cerevisiae S288C]P47055.1 RecName: Full=Outer spore wall protein 4; AltName: Full=Loss of heterozygosity protein 1; Flags: Precursor [Saccharomyces cerevisiae S288C]AAS56571.1 YJL038C [Saccharomyces cerevisiae]AJR54597.1 Loh1p [Saccharomyces cerevisiae YJM683]AJR59162.1 Loh1p [Saccharomyces cerevisiae YJM1133]AJR61778.1 Loh1p [Saccharomyces cerevisiae YJM320]AJR62439.1 Loh1p [Saccharomyces cerevisiae YJM428]AJR64634.1 Loh1p [Saccharomyces cerevisiae YJM554]AJR66274.1|eukprot:NP_012496.1 Loh1p [Saccharomyces cerevisiae S288C]
MRFQLFIYFYFTIVVIAGTNTIQQFSDAGDRLITSLRNLDNNGTYETLTAEKVPIIEGQIQNISAKYEQHTFILKGLEAVLNYKVKSLDNNERESLEIEYEKVEKALDAALNVSPFEYIKKFKEVSRGKVVNALENLSREQNRITINGGREDEKEKEAREKKKRLDRIKRILTVSLLELGLAQGVADLCAVAPFACLLGVTVGSIGFIFWLALIYNAIQ